jgi:hypothetical protein
MLAKDSEEQEQINFIIWCANHPNPDLAKIFAIPNGEKRSPKVGAKLKRLGVKRGIPDLFLPVARHGFYGLFIEMKKKKGGRLSDDQKIQISILESDGYAVAVCAGTQHAIIAVCKYLDLDVDKIINS